MGELYNRCRGYITYGTDCNGATYTLPMHSDDKYHSLDVTYDKIADYCNRCTVKRCFIRPEPVLDSSGRDITPSPIYCMGNKDYKIRDDPDAAVAIFCGVFAVIFMIALVIFCIFCI